MGCCKADKDESKNWCKPYGIAFTDEEGKEYCVFHAPKDNKGISLEEFNNLVFAEIDNAKISARLNEKYCDLSSVIFPGPIDFSMKYHENKPLPRMGFFDAEFNGTANFMLVWFSDVYFNNVKFDKAGFVNTKFNGDALFEGAEFNGEALFGLGKFKGASFCNSTFNDEANFNDSIFTEKADFSKSNFNKDATFNDAIFTAEAEFRGSIFSGYSNFIDTKFNNETNFSVAEFDKAIFAHAKFNGETYFLDSVFGQETNFNKARFNEDADFNGASFDGFVDFSFARFHKLIRFSKVKSNYVFNGEVRFVDIIIKEKLRLTDVNLSKVSFLYSDLKKMDFIGCEWGKNKGRYILYDEINIFKNKNNSKFKDEIKKVETLYRRLKQKYKEEHNEPEVSCWHYCEKEMQKEREKRKYLNLYALYYLSSGYGEKPLKAIIVLFSLILTLTFSLNFFGVQTNPVYCSDPSCIETIQGFSMKPDWQHLKSLTVTAFQHLLFVRTPDYLPLTDYGKFIVLLLSKLLIPLQAALFAFSLRNRFRR